MKRSVFSLLLLGIGLFVVGVSIWHSRTPIVTLAVEQSLPKEEVAAPSATASVSEKEDYALPYSGLLPDHPLYFLKMARDRIQLWLTRQPLARTKLLLHYADKRIAASLALAEKGKVGLAISTATKAEKYLEQALEAAKLAEVRGEDTKDFYHQFFKATEKHEKVLLGVLSRTPGEAQAAVESVLELNGRIHEEVGRKLGEDESGGEELNLDEDESAEDRALEGADDVGDEEDQEGVEIQDRNEKDMSEDEGKG